MSRYFCLTNNQFIDNGIVQFEQFSKGGNGEIYRMAGKNPMSDDPLYEDSDLDDYFDVDIDAIVRFTRYDGEDVIFDLYELNQLSGGFNLSYVDLVEGIMNLFYPEVYLAAGDVVIYRDPKENYRNDGVFVSNGRHLVALSTDLNEYGHIPIPLMKYVKIDINYIEVDPETGTPYTDYNFVNGMVRWEIL